MVSRGVDLRNSMPELYNFDFEGHFPSAVKSIRCAVLNSYFSSLFRKLKLGE